jgi:hypothetical protein
LNNLIKPKTKNTTLSEHIQIQKTIVEICKIDAPSTKMNARSLSWLGTDTSIKGGGMQLVSWALISPLKQLCLIF